VKKIQREVEDSEPRERGSFRHLKKMKNKVKYLQAI
jgi:hypothetical protein